MKEPNEREKRAEKIRLLRNAYNTLAEVGGISQFVYAEILARISLLENENLIEQTFRNAHLREDFE